MSIGGIYGAYGQARVSKSKAYSRALDEYIKAVYPKGTAKPDTLFIGKNEHMDGVKLPGVVQGATVDLLTSEDAQKKLSYRRSLIYLNIVGWLDKHTAEFLIVTFLEFKPQRHCYLYFTNAAGGEMKLDSLRFKYPYGNTRKVKAK
ncbi:MAG: hypothetical protein V4649_13500 [Bacteroidota bacterium]